VFLWSWSLVLLSACMAVPLCVCSVLAFLSLFVSCLFVLVCLCFCVRNSNVAGQCVAVLQLLCLCVCVALSFRFSSVLLSSLLCHTHCLRHVMHLSVACTSGCMCRLVQQVCLALPPWARDARPRGFIIKANFACLLVCTASLAMHVHNLPSCFRVLHFVCARASFSIFARMGQILCSACVTRDNGG
jgi:hypothetical protein